MVIEQFVGSAASKAIIEVSPRYQDYSELGQLLMLLRTLPRGYSLDLDYGHRFLEVYYDYIRLIRDDLIFLMYPSMNQLDIPYDFFEFNLVAWGLKLPNQLSEKQVKTAQTLMESPKMVKQAIRIKETLFGNAEYLQKQIDENPDYVDPIEWTYCVGKETLFEPNGKTRSKQKEADNINKLVQDLDLYNQKYDECQRRIPNDG